MCVTDPDESADEDEEDSIWRDLRDRSLADGEEKSVPWTVPLRDEACGQSYIQSALSARVIAWCILTYHVVLNEQRQKLLKYQSILKYFLLRISSTKKINNNNKKKKKEKKKKIQSYK